VVSVAPGGKHIALAVRGKLGPLLRVLSDTPIDDLTFAPPDLESVFLHYYSDEEKPERPSEAQAPVEVRR
jgi:ABC-2 type transport system ATP-binding protein